MLVKDESASEWLKDWIQSPQPPTSPLASSNLLFPRAFVYQCSKKVGSRTSKWNSASPRRGDEVERVNPGDGGRGA